MKRYIVSGLILLAMSMACEEKKKVRRQVEPQVKLTEVTSSPDITLPSINVEPSDTHSADVKPVVEAKVEAPKVEEAKVPVQEKITLAAKTSPVRYEDTTTRDLAEGSANEVKDEGLERIREKALARARELEAEEAAKEKAEAEALAKAEAEALAEAEKAKAIESAPAAVEGSKVAMVEPSEPASEVAPAPEAAAEIPTDVEPVKFKQNVDRKTSKALEVRFNKAVILVKQHKLEQAKNEFLTICQAGHAHACHKFAWYEEQAGNKANATRFYRAACDNGLGKACNNLAFQFEQKKNFDEAITLYSRGCLEKHEASCQSLKRIKDDHKMDGLQTR